MIKTCRNLLYAVWIVAGILGCIGIGVAWISGLQPRIVLSGSMEPEIKTGSMVFIREDFPVEKIRERDVIAFQMDESMEVLHRVVSVEKDKKEFQTKGDANPVADFAGVGFEQYRGKEVLDVPYLGYLVGFLQKDMVLISLILLTALISVGSMIMEKERRHKNQEFI